MRRHALRAQRYQLLKLIIAPLEYFVSLSVVGGVVLLAATVAALVWANGSEAQQYHQLWSSMVDMRWLDYSARTSIGHAINDGLMTLFFFVVGLEIKREVVSGELSNWRQAVLPIVGAIGGMVVPGLLYLAVTRGKPAAVGWGVPMATDIAFALGVLTLLGKRVPSSLKVFLTALAIVDDLGAVVVIALFYTHTLSLAMLISAFGLTLALALMNKLGVKHPAFYTLSGILLWWLTLQSGVHATVAGVALAMVIPMRGRVDAAAFLKQAQRLLNDLGQRHPDRFALIHEREAHAVLQAIKQGCAAAQPTLTRFEHALHGPVAFLLMPVFAFANAGVTFESPPWVTLADPLALGIFLGLLVGKPLGIVGFCAIFVRFRWASLPEGAGWGDMLGIGLLAGIGFTMSIFIASLAFPSAVQLAHAKEGILLASAAAALMGMIWCLWGNPALLARKRS